MSTAKEKPSESVPSVPGEKAARQDRSEAGSSKAPAKTTQRETPDKAVKGGAGNSSKSSAGKGKGADGAKKAESSSGSKSAAKAASQPAKRGTRASGPLANVDLGLVDALCSLQADRLVVQGRLEKLESESASVSQEVVARVRADYLSQRQELDQKARPLEAKVRKEYAQVRSLLQDAKSSVGAAKRDKEELELRNRLGEFEEGQFATSSKELASALVAKEKSLSAVEKVRARFLEAFESEADLERDVEPAPTPEPSPEKPVVAEEPVDQVVASSGAPPISPPVPPAEGGGDTTDLDPVLSDATELVELPPPPPSVAGRSGFVPAADDATLPPLPSSGTGPETETDPGDRIAAGADGGTVILPPPARLAPEDDSEPDVEAFVLGLVTSIGRTPDNQLQINLPEVSRRHAQISLTESGYRFEDLGSENGSYLNGDAVTETLLKPGDRLQIGSRRFVFETG